MDELKYAGDSVCVRIHEVCIYRAASDWSKLFPSGLTPDWSRRKASEILTHALDGRYIKEWQVNDLLRVYLQV